MKYLILTLMLVLLAGRCMAAELTEAQGMYAKNSKLYDYRDVCIDGLRFIKMRGEEGTLVQVFVPVENQVTTGWCMNGSCTVSKNTILTSVPAKCK